MHKGWQNWHEFRSELKSRPDSFVVQVVQVMIDVSKEDCIHNEPVSQCTKMRIKLKSGRLSSTGSEILTSGSHCSANFQPILDCFIPKFKLEFDDLENIKTDRLNTVLFNLRQIKQSKVFETPGTSENATVMQNYVILPGVPSFIHPALTIRRNNW